MTKKHGCGNRYYSNKNFGYEISEHFKVSNNWNLEKIKKTYVATLHIHVKIMDCFDKECTSSIHGVNIFFLVVVLFFLLNLINFFYLIHTIYHLYCQFKKSTPS